MEMIERGRIRSSFFPRTEIQEDIYLEEEDSITKLE